MEIGELKRALLTGLVIPAHPLALNADRQLDERRQRALTRYYLSSGAGGLAVGVHTTQFEIHDPASGLYPRVLELAMAERTRLQSHSTPVVMIAGLVGKTRQAVSEAEWAQQLGYHCGLLSLGAMRDEPEDKLIDHCRQVADVLPLFGFYLQPAVGGRELSASFWRELAKIDRLVAIKIAPFDRYQTLEVIRAVAESGRSGEIALYTGNDDHILLDLLTPFQFRIGGESRTLKIVGGLLGQWAVWTRRAVELFSEVRAVAESGQAIPKRLLALASELTDANAAIFDVRNRFAGCIPGIHEVLRRQRLMAGTWCLDPGLALSPGQSQEIDRVCRAYPHLTDDDFVKQYLEDWLAP